MSPAKKTARKTTKKKAAPARKKTAPKKAASKKKAAKAAPKKKATSKKAAAKKTTAKKKAAPKKAAPKKSTARKAAPKKAAKPAAKKAAPKKAAPAAKAAGKKKAAKPRRKAKPAIAPEIVKPGLGGKWECFSCGAKFYDLGKPEPICPKCGADQRDRPRDRPAATNVAPTRRPAVAPMAPPPVVDEDEEPVQDFEAGDGEIEALDEKGFLNTDGATDDDDATVDVRVIDDD